MNQPNIDAKRIHEGFEKAGYPHIDIHKNGLFVVIFEPEPYGVCKGALTPSYDCRYVGNGVYECFYRDLPDNDFSFEVEI